MDWEAGSRRLGRDGWAAFPGLSSYLSRCENVYSQRLPLGKGWPPLTGNKPRPMSQSFSLEVAAIPLWDSQPHHPSLLPPTSPLLDTLPHLSLSGKPARGCQGQAGSVKMKRGCLPSLLSLLKLEWRNTAPLTSEPNAYHLIWFVSQPFFLTGFDTSPRSLPTVAPLFLI